ncbi:hypothetical protein [Kiloniella antarctica]|uniref:Uncharacterized protein n=1 Tax=Kiloniella antarctica TaxID=1550907 RepID=A0ABW5BJ71_9PROT
MSDTLVSNDIPSSGGASPHYSSGYSDQPASQDSGSFYEQSPVEDTREGDKGSETNSDIYAPSSNGEPEGSENLETNNREGSVDNPEGFIKLPGEGANEDEIDAFYEALGVPDSPEGYELVIPKEMGEDQSGGEWKEYTSAISQLSHALGLSPSQAQALTELDLQAKSQSYETMEREQQHYLEQQIEDTTSALREEWGSNMDTNVRTANRALKAFGGSELEGVLSEAGVLNDPVVLRAFHKAGLSLVEDSSPGGAGASRRNRSAAEILYPSSTKEG